MIGLALLGTIPAGCSKARTSAASIPPSRVGITPSEEDHSLSVGEYIARGMPTLEREWVAQDFEDAAQVLKRLAQEDSSRLPRFESVKSGALFARFANPENLTVLRDRSLPIKMRVGLLDEYLTGMKTILRVYIDALMRGQPTDREVIRMMGVLTRLTRLTYPLMYEFTATLPPDDPKMEARRAGIQQMREGTATMLQGWLLTLTERSHYRKEELLILCGYLKDDLPALFPELLPEAQTQVRNKLRQLGEQEKDPDLQKAIAELRDALPSP